MHWPKPADGPRLMAGEAAALAREGLYLDTCLRQLVFGSGERPVLATAVTPELYTGGEAWRLMLEIACGLRSAVPGETNVFGQFRAAWRAAVHELPEDRRRPLVPQVEALIADARTVRTSHLQGIGGSSYGSLARRLLTPEVGSRLLFVGGGALTRSMLPLFAHCELGVWNRREACDLPRQVRVFRPAERTEAARWAERVVFTTPPDEHHDRLWRRALAQAGLRAVLHLGRRRADGCGRSVPKHDRDGGPIPTWDLDDIFELARTRENVRSLQIARARQACAELAAARWDAPVPVAAGREARAAAG